MHNLLIVESPGKVKTLKKILGSDWEVLPSVGHIRQLAKDGPNNLGIEIEGDRIHCHYEPNGERGVQVIAKLRSSARRASSIYLAPDPDREGEAIAWHLAEVLGIAPSRALRVSYTQITAAAVRAAIAAPRRIDENLVHAQRARQVLDRLVGWGTSPLAWKVGGRSAGRVQSAALHLVCERERAIARFTPQDYWSIWVDYAQPDGSTWRAYYSGQDAPAPSAPAAGEGLDDAGERPQQTESSRVLSQRLADELVALAAAHPHFVHAAEDEQTTKAPPPPFTTSSLQQAASSQLGFTPEHTMAIAQKLYEGVDLAEGPKGLITYMRTDSVALAPEFVESVRAYLGRFDPSNLPERPTRHRAKESAQEAHEAIRPTSIELEPGSVRAYLTDEQFRLYDLIWRRALASQCAPSRLDRRRILTRSGPVFWEARGFSVAAPGYTRYWPNLDDGVLLPAVSAHDPLNYTGVASTKKRTQPPARYSGAKLIQIMETHGIGRPSTYAPTVKTLFERGYVESKGKSLLPTALGMRVDELFSEHLGDLVDTDFTAEMEETLDEIAQGTVDWESWLVAWNRDFLTPALEAAARSTKLLAPPETEQSGSSAPRPPLELSKQKCPQCQRPMGKLPCPKLPKKYFLKCEHCSDVRLFWSEFKKGWEPPRQKSANTSTGSPLPPPRQTGHPCPVCNKPLEELFYFKEGQTRSLLRCSDANTRSKPNHSDTVFYHSRGVWWSKIHGELPIEESFNQKTC